MSGKFESADSKYIEGTNLVYNGAIKNVNGATLSAWIYADSLPYTPSIIFVLSTNFWSNPRAKIGVNADGSITGCGRCADGDSNQSANSSAGDILTGRLYNIIGLFDYTNKTIKLYKNGSLVKTQSGLSWSAAPTSNTDSTLTMIGGYSAGTEWVNGYIEDCRAYDRLLPENEIQSIYTCRGSDNIFYGLKNRFRLFGKHDVDLTIEKDKAIMQYNLTRYSAEEPETYEDRTWRLSRRQRAG